MPLLSAWGSGKAAEQVCILALVDLDTAGPSTKRSMLGRQRLTCTPCGTGGLKFGKCSDVDNRAVHIYFSRGRLSNTQLHISRATSSPHLLHARGRLSRHVCPALVASSPHLLHARVSRIFSKPLSCSECGTVTAVWSALVAIAPQAGAGRLFEDRAAAKHGK